MSAYSIENLHLNRVNVKVEDNVKEWYIYKSRTMGMTTSQLMAYVLSDYYEKQKNADAIQIIAEATKNPQQIPSDVSDMLSVMKAVVQLKGSEPSEK